METKLWRGYRRLQDKNKDAVNEHAEYLLWKQEAGGESGLLRRGDTTKKAE